MSRPRTGKKSAEPFRRHVAGNRWESTTSNPKPEIDHVVRGGLAAEDSSIGVGAL